MANAKSLLITPPVRTRITEASADSAIIELMASEVAEGSWVTDGNTYENYGDAGNAAQIHRRALAAALDLGVHQVKSRTWGQDKDGNLLDKDKDGTWRFALSLDPNRKQRTRRTNSTPAATPAA